LKSRAFVLNTSRRIVPNSTNSQVFVALSGCICYNEIVIVNQLATGGEFHV
jgi:hypothetical protein